MSPLLNPRWASWAHYAAAHQAQCSEQGCKLKDPMCPVASPNGRPFRFNRRPTPKGDNP